MITVQVNTPQQQSTSQFEQAALKKLEVQGKWPQFRNVLQQQPPILKPSKSSASLSKQDYEHYFTMEGRNTVSARFKRFLPPIDIKVVTFCLVWYFLSAISSNITKVILKQFPHPTTLTEVQFLISVLFCVGTLALINNNRWLIEKFPLGAIPSRDKFHSERTTWNLLQPTPKILRTVGPMGMFQFVGHITSHQATSVIPVSLVHSVKALSPLSTVLAYRFIFHTKYPTITYLTLLPLMFGVILTCFSNNRRTSTADSFTFYKGLIYAFISMIIFVSQNIFAKKILTVKPQGLPTRSKPTSFTTKTSFDDDDEEKIDKTTILLYCSLIGFILTLPVYMVSEFYNNSLTLLDIDFTIFSLFLLHGLTHFCQAMLAFHLIGLVSPVNYSIANILKRIVVIGIALLWERESFNANQGIGLLFTMAGLYAYDRWGMVKK